MDLSAYTPLATNELTEDTLVNAPVYGPEDEKIGTISHLHGTGATIEVIVDVGGFLGIGSKPVRLNRDQVHLMRDGAGKVHGHTAWTKDQLKDLPEHLD
jgi:hypothetical protein